MKLHVLLEVAAVSRLVLAVGAGQRFGAVVHLAGVPGHFVLVSCQVGATLALEGTLTCKQEGERTSAVEMTGRHREFMQPAGGSDSGVHAHF